MTIPRLWAANQKPASHDADQSEASTPSHIHHGLPTSPVIKIISDSRTEPSCDAFGTLCPEWWPQTDLEHVSCNFIRAQGTFGILKTSLHKGFALGHTFWISKSHLHNPTWNLKNSLVGFSHRKTNVVSISSLPEYKWRQFVQFICLFLNPKVSPHSGILVPALAEEVSAGCSKLGVFINCFYVAASIEIKIQPGIGQEVCTFQRNKNYSFSFESRPGLWFMLTFYNYRLGSDYARYTEWLPAAPGHWGPVNAFSNDISEMGIM